MEVRGVEPLSKIPSAFAHTCVSFAFKVSLLKTPVKVGAEQELACEVQALRSGKRKTLSCIASELLSRQEREKVRHCLFKQRVRNRCRLSFLGFLRGQPTSACN